MAKAKKLPSGAWRTQVYSHTEDGKKKYMSFTADTKAESEYMAAQFIHEKKANIKPRNRTRLDMTVKEAISQYIALSALLSPTTLHRYQKIQEYSFKSIMDMQVKKIDDISMQMAVNQESMRRNARCPNKPISAKTVCNEYALVSSALKAICGVTYNVKLPKKTIKNKEYPDPERVIAAVKGTSIELPCLLAIWLSFSMSEIRGLKCSSIHDGIISIDRVLVDVGSTPILKDTAKAEKRIRKHEVPEYIMQLIEKQESYQRYITTGEDGFLITMTRNMIVGRYETILKNNGLSLSFHDLRHLNASVMLMLNIPEKYAMERGGWKTPHVMKTVYQHTFDSERRRVDSMINSYFDEIMKE